MADVDIPMLCICGKPMVVETPDLRDPDALSLHFPTPDRVEVEYHHADGTPSCQRQFLPERGLGLRTTEYCQRCRGLQHVRWEGMPFQSQGACEVCGDPWDDLHVENDASAEE